MIGIPDCLSTTQETPDENCAVSEKPDQGQNDSENEVRFQSTVVATGA